MRKRLAIGSVLAAALMMGGPVTAGVYADDLSKCLVKSASDGDKSTLTQFIFAAMSDDPTVKDMSSVVPAQRTALVTKYVEIVQRLMFVDCRREATDALKYEGRGVIEQSFSLLGQVAMRQLMSGPGFQRVTKDVAAHMDKDRWLALLKEGGIADARSSSPTK